MLAVLVASLLPWSSAGQSCAPSLAATTVGGGQLRTQLLAFDVVNTHPTLPLLITGFTIGLNATGNVSVFSRVRARRRAPLA